MEWVCWLFGALLMITLVGHGIWVLLAMIFRAGKPKASPRAERTGEEGALDLRLRELLEAGLIDGITYRRVMVALEARARQSAAAAMPLPVPVLPLAPASAEDAPAPTLSAPEPAPPRSAQTPAVIAPASPPVPIAPKFPRAPRRPLSEVFAGFLQESNVRWGELIGGLLIVGCSVALVVSFWSQIAGRPFFQFGIFTGVTAAAFGLGLYAEHRWKLPTTSRGILLIATMLVPLNFMAFTALSHGRAASIGVTAGELVALASFGLLAWQAARVLAPCWPEFLTAGVLLLSGSLLVTQQIGTAGSPVSSMALGGCPVAIYGAVIGLVLRRANRWRQIRNSAAEAIFLILGVLAFAAGLAIGALFLRTDSPGRMARELSPLLSIAALPGLATGLFLWRRITDKRLAAARTAGTSIAIAGAFLMLGCIALAWPDPRSMLPLAAVDFVVLTAVALRFDLPFAHALATPCLAIACAVGVEVARHHVGWTSSPEQMLHILAGPTLGPALLPLVLAFAAIAWIGCGRPTTNVAGLSGRLPEARRDWSALGRIYGWSGVIVALISIALVTTHGFARAGDPQGAAWIYLTYAAVAILAARRFARLAAGWAGTVLLVACFVQFFLTRTTVHFPPATALLAYSTIAVAGTAWRWRNRAGADAVLIPAKWTATMAIAVATAILIERLSLASAAPIATRIFWASGIGFTIAAMEASEGLFVAAQIGLALSATLAVLARLQARRWFVASPEPLLEPWTLQATGVALAVVACAFSLARRVVPRRWTASRWLNRGWAFDRVLAAGVFVLFAALVACAFVDGAEIEFSTGAFRPVSDTWSAHAAGGGTWVLLGAVVVLLATEMRDRFARVMTPALTVLPLFACALWAARYSAEGAGASATRWALAAVLMIESIAVWLRHRFPARAEASLNSVRPVLAPLMAVPILVLSIYPASLTLAGWHPAGPSALCFFGRIGNATSYLVPLGAVAVAFVGNAIRERADGWAVAGSAVCNLMVTLGYTLALVTRGEPFTAASGVRLIQLNTLAVALFAILWQTARGVTGARKRAGLLEWEASAAWLGTGILLVPAAVWIFVFPGAGARTLASVGSPVGWAAFFATAAAGILIRKGGPHALSPRTITGIALGAGSLAAAGVMGRGGGWTGYHLLMATAVFSSVINVGAGAWIYRARRGWAETETSSNIPAVAAPQPVELQYRRPDRLVGGPGGAAVYVDGQLLQPAVMRWTGLASALAILLSIRTMAGDPARPWWSVATTATVSLLWAALACWMLAPRLLYVSGLLLNLAITFWFADRVAPASAAPLFDLTSANIAVLAVAGVAALVLHLNLFARRHAEAARAARLPFHRFAAFVSVASVVATACVVITADVHGQSVADRTLLQWAATGSAFVLSAAMLWDAEAPFALQEVYVLGMAVVALALRGVHYFHQPVQVAGAIAAAAYVFLPGVAYSLRERLAHVARAMGMPPVRRPDQARWIIPASTALALVAIAFAFASDFTITTLAPRLGAATAVLVCLIGLMSLSGAIRRPDLDRVTFALLRIAGAAWAWAWVNPEAPSLGRAVILLGVLGVSLLACGILAAREPAGSNSTGIAGDAFASATFGWMASVLLTIALEIAQQRSGNPTHIAPLASAVVLANLLIGMVAGVRLALMRRPDPLNLSTVARAAYVYAAEALLALVFVHLRITAPWLFGGMMAQYWPLLVMAIAFAAVALADLFRRNQTIALSSPLFVTGAFLPLLPVAAFWLAPSRVELWALLCTAALFYAILSAARRSFGFGVLAALAANGGLWSILARQPALAFLVHPQVWLIPAATSVLAAAQLNRERLSAQQLRFVRYCCLMIIYVSSTADIFLNGVADHPALPLVLAGVSVAGVMLGILFRLRAFLFLGTSFLVLSIATMIYYASVDLHWTWLWYVTGIALGAVILATFALFEKKRAEMVALVDGLKRWN